MVSGTRELEDPGPVRHPRLWAGLTAASSRDDTLPRGTLDVSELSPCTLHQCRACGQLPVCVIDAALEQSHARSFTLCVGLSGPSQNT